jgi:hypothetical protein
LLVVVVVAITLDTAMVAEAAVVAVDLGRAPDLQSQAAQLIP